MRAFPALVAAMALAGCAHTGVSLFNGEKNINDGTQNPTGAVAVLDPLTGQDVLVVDKADVRRNVRKNKVSIKNVTAAQLNARYGSLLASMPEQPKKFIFYFDAGSSDLTAESKGFLPDLIAEVKRRPGVDLQIVGHSDTTGPLELNDKLSQDRAETVKGMLAGLGLNGEVIRAAGRGERDLLQDTPDETPSDLNRRVEVYVK